MEQSGYDPWLSALSAILHDARLAKQGDVYYPNVHAVHAKLLFETQA